jgi:hypothetical protein
MMMERIQPFPVKRRRPVVWLYLFLQVGVAIELILAEVNSRVSSLQTRIVWELLVSRRLASLTSISLVEPHRLRA